MLLLTRFPIGLILIWEAGTEGGELESNYYLLWQVSYPLCLRSALDQAVVMKRN